ncbi:MAG: hypothetical protein R3B98_10360 [Hyphomonas sp.]
MSRPVRSLTAAILLLGTAQAAFAEPIVRDPGLLETLSIEGISLATPPEEAFDALAAAGYSANGVAAYDAWTHGSLEMVRGVYGAPSGYSSVTIGRADGHLAMITQTLNKPGIDVAAKIGSVQSHLGIAADEHDCRVNSAGTSGSCQASDAAEPDAETVKFSMTAMPMMIMQSVSRPRELVDTLQ